eukprot:9046402-Lingulodinium_polyedra.AAC.1
MERASVRIASRCDRETTSRLCHSVAFHKLCAITWSNQSFAAVAAHKSTFARSKCVARHGMAWHGMAEHN